ncbi:hypothetical protein SESBI_38526 [Sesbania bispinosa]|nr:hypothetical protein SESBI_38526 [Sesbania bispinosa]
MLRLANYIEAEEGESGVEAEAATEDISEVVGELEGDTVKGVGTGLEGKWTMLKEIVSRDCFEGNFIRGLF